MSLLNELSKKEVWERFYEYKTSLACPKDITGRLRDFIDGEEYLPVCECIDRNERFALPARSVISKQSSQKKRTVYTYPYAENTVLKLLVHSSLYLKVPDIGILTLGFFGCDEIVDNAYTGSDGKIQYIISEKIQNKDLKNHLNKIGSHSDPGNLVILLIGSK